VWTISSSTARACRLMRPRLLASALMRCTVRLQIVVAFPVDEERSSRPRRTRPERSPGRDHQMRLEGRCVTAKGLDDRRVPWRDSHEVPVHHSTWIRRLQPVRPRHLLAQTGEVGRENRRASSRSSRAQVLTPRRCSESMHPAGRCTPPSSMLGRQPLHQRSREARTTP